MNDAEIDGARGAVRGIDDGRVVDKHVESPTVSLDGGYSFFDGFLPIEVQFHGMNSETLGAELRCRRFARGAIPRSQKDQEPGLSQLPGDLQADSFVGARNKRRFL